MTTTETTGTGAGAAWAIIPAAGRGARFGSSENKVFADLLGRPLLGWTLEAFALCDAIDGVVIVGSETELARLQTIGETYGGGKVRAVVQGGKDRRQSVRAGLHALPQAVEWVAVHDAARPCVTPELVQETLAAAQDDFGFGSATVVTYNSDTLIRAARVKEGYEGRAFAVAGENIPRAGVAAVQTPQAFRRSILQAVHDAASPFPYPATDDAGLVRAFGYHVRLVPGPRQNIKVTEADDLALAAAILSQRQTVATVTL